MTKYKYPKSLPLITFFLNAETIRKNPIPFHKKSFEKYGDSFSVSLGWSRKIMLTRDPLIVKHILQKHHKNYFKSKIQTKYLTKYLGFGLLTSNGEQWLKQRRLIQPAFHKHKMEQLIGLMQTTIHANLDHIETDKLISVFPVMNTVAFNVIANSLFSESTHNETLSRLQKIIEQIQVFLVKEVRLPHKGWWFKLSGQVKHHKTLSEESRSILRNIIEERQRSQANHDDLLDMLLATRYEDTGKAMSMEQLIDEISILFVAGHETTANALTFTLFLLAKHPEIYTKVYEETVRVESEAQHPIERIGKLIYTRACIDEAMRLYPPAWITDRENYDDDSVGDFHIKKNTLIGVSFYELHRHPDYWERPNEFVPERFLGENKKKTTGHYYPFGAGPRMCIGLGFAIYEMVLTVSYIAKRYHLSTTQKEVRLNPLITLKPVDVSIIFNKR